VKDRGIQVQRGVMPAAPRNASEPVKTPRGIRVEGPLGSRSLLEFRLPEYPEWARRQGIEASVSLRCEVAADGAVSDVILLEGSSGHTELDEAAKAALARFKFSPIAGTEVQWGVVISDPVGKTIRAFDGTGSLPSRLTWDGRDNTGAPGALNLLRRYQHYYNEIRTHGALNKDSPDGREVQGPDRSAKIVSIPRVGGLHHHYERLAA
jgi:TonB family protein